MTMSIAAVFENGTFRPTNPVRMAEGTRVELIVLTDENNSTTGNRAAEILAEIAALPTSGGDPSTSNNHDQVLYPEQKAR